MYYQTNHINGLFAPTFWLVKRYHPCAVFVMDVWRILSSSLLKTSGSLMRLPIVWSATRDTRMLCRNTKILDPPVGEQAEGEQVWLSQLVVGSAAGRPYTYWTYQKPTEECYVTRDTEMEERDMDRDLGTPARALVAASRAALACTRCTYRAGTRKVFEGGDCRAPPCSTCSCLW